MKPFSLRAKEPGNSPMVGWASPSKGMIGERVTGASTPIASPQWTRTMRDEFTSNGFLAVAIAGLVLLSSGLLALAFI
jgi:hypothetical protein